MSVTKDEAKQKVAELVAKYENLSSSQVKAFNEANTKQSFIEPLFKALGWDVDDANEVTLEEKASSGRVDYAFKLNGVSYFYLEAKALKADLTNPDFIKQAVTYAYNKGVTWVVLTDFEELRLFNAQQNKPFITLKSQDYLSTFDKLWLLSHDSLADGLLNKEAAQSGALQYTLPVEKRLFRQLRQWREDLFNQLHLYNKDLTFNLIDEVIQRLFDRLIFIRTCEDRGIEDKRLLAAVNRWKTGGHKGELVEPLRQIFREFNGYYDSDLFARHPADDVFIMGTTLEEIISGLYEVPGGMTSYDFSIIDADVLGAVYEQYLGHVAQVVKQRTKEAQARMDLGILTESITLTAKKERRKEQGIYYTPKFVTDYIVKETVGRFIKEHTPNEINNIRILDPACGSGSFLIRAYDELLNYHANQKSKPLPELDQWERLPILTGNIFGVDLDTQAVEIARLNLLLRSLARREILPSLKENIRQGNSLISCTEEDLKKHFGDSWREEKPFNWEEEFREIMAQGGFDVVISNPPYVEFKRLDSNMKAILETKFQSAHGKYDIYVPFLEQGIRLLKPGGYLGFICPTMFMKRDYGKSLRSFLINNSTLRSFVDFADNQVFGEAINYVGIFILQKTSNSTIPCLCRVLEPNLGLLADELGRIILSDKSSDEVNVFLLNMTQLNESAWTIAPTGRFEFCAELHKRAPTTLSELCDAVWEGIASGKDQVFYLKLEKAHISKVEESLLHPLLRGKDVFRWSPLNNIPFQVLYPYDITTDEPISEEDLKVNFPHAYEYFIANREQLKGRGYFDATTKLWYELWCERQPTQFSRVKILTPEISKHNNFTLDVNGYFFNTKVYGIIKRDNVVEDYKYLLGILNSSLLEYYYQTFAPPKAGGFYAYKTAYLRGLPIRRIDFNNPAEKKIHDTLVSLVDKILELNKRLAPIRDSGTNEEKELCREIERTDNKIDNLVCDLYRLTEAERKIVEASVEKNHYL